MANMKCALPVSLVGSILSFTVHGHDESELNKMRNISPKLQKAIDCNPILFNREEPLLEIRDYKDESINGVWHLKNIKTSQLGGKTFPGTDTVIYIPNPIRNIQMCVIQSKQYSFTRELNGEIQELTVVSRKTVPKHFHQDRPLPNDPMWKDYRMDHQKDSNYDLRLTFPIESEAELQVLFSSKKTIGQDLWSEKQERLCRFTVDRRPVRDQDRSSTKNPANYTPFKPASWVKLVTPLKPIFSDPKSEKERKERIAAQQAEVEKVIKERGQAIQEMLKGKTQKEMLEIMQSEEYQHEVMQVAEFMQQSLTAGPPETSEVDYDAAWALGEHAMDYFRIRLFDPSGSLAP